MKKLIKYNPKSLQMAMLRAKIEEESKERDCLVLHDYLVSWAAHHAKQIMEEVGIKVGAKDKLSVIWEHPLGYNDFRAGKFIATGYLDLLLGAGPADYAGFEYSVCVEAKSYIKSIGELIRQLRGYRASYHEHLDLVVVSPDTKAAKILAQQGITYINPDTCSWNTYRWRSNDPTQTVLRLPGAKERP